MITRIYTITARKRTTKCYMTTTVLKDKVLRMDKIRVMKINHSLLMFIQKPMVMTQTLNCKIFLNDQVNQDDLSKHKHNLKIRMTPIATPNNRMTERKRVENIIVSQRFGETQGKNNSKASGLQISRWQLETIRWAERSTMIRLHKVLILIQGRKNHSIQTFPASTICRTKNSISRVRTI